MQEMIAANVDKRTAEVMVRAVGGLGKKRSDAINITLFFS